jgi:hypothetical protein
MKTHLVSPASGDATAGQKGNEVAAGEFRMTAALDQGTGREAVAMLARE